MYKIGVVGIGHWFGRLHEGMNSIGGLEVKKALGTKPYESKANMLDKFGISKDMYLTTDSSGKIPEEFFEGIDAVHISDPNMYHTHQAISSLENNKKAIVEKSFAVNKEEFDSFIQYLKDNKKENDTYLHLHYIHKQPTIALKGMIGQLVKENGRISEVHSTFFESENNEDARRSWLFGIDNGGLFMDWIHPFEVISHSCSSKFGTIEELGLYRVNEMYSKNDPTGIYASTQISGTYFSANARMNVNIAKGVEKRFAQKAMRIIFESGKCVTLLFAGSEDEFGKSNRGAIEFGEVGSGQYSVQKTEDLKGDNSSEIFVKQIINLCSGKNDGLTIDEISNIFTPQWEYQHMLDNSNLTIEPRAVRRFIEKGYRL